VLLDTIAIERKGQVVVGAGGGSGISRSAVFRRERAMTETSTDTDPNRPLTGSPGKARIVAAARAARWPRGRGRIVCPGQSALRGQVDRSPSVDERVSREGLRMAAVLAPVICAGAVALVAAAWALAVSGVDGPTIAGAAALLLASAIAEALPVPLEGVSVGRTSLATVFIVASAVLYGWTVATIVAAGAMASVELVGRKRVVRLAFNAAVYALAGIAAGAVADGVAGSSLVRVSLATAAAATAFYLVNITLVAAVVSSSTGGKVGSLVGGYLYRTLAPFGVMACLALILVIIWERSPFAAFVLAGPLASIVLHERWMHRALMRLRDLDRLKDEFIAVVSHELRTPLTSVYGAAMTLQRADVDTKTRESLLGIIYQEAARLARLVDQILWTSRLESDREKLAVSTIDPLQIAQEVVDATRRRLLPGLSIELVSGSSVAAVSADAEKMKQVLVNLVENAVKYSPEGGRIEVRLAPAGDLLRFSVQDDGLGIPAAEHERIFEKFHRLDPDLTRGVGGTGLGLYICRQIVERMNGRIWVASELGKGSTFFFELPLADRIPTARVTR
jgi:signal transduction histidine kinase